MKDLTDVLLEAIDLHASYELPTLRFPEVDQRLVVASGNALPTGRMILDDGHSVFADEGQFRQALKKVQGIDAAVVISASGTKHSPLVVSDLLSRSLQVTLITCNSESPAARLLPPEHVYETRSNPEPITYNTSTYLGMLLAKTREDPAAIKKHLLDVVTPLIGDVHDYAAFYFIVPPRFDVLREMFITKFDELFGGRLNGRCYTTEQTFHAKTVVPWEKELFISIGYENQFFGTHRVNIPIPDDCGYASMLATGYFVIGNIQSQFPPWFKEHAQAYEAFQSAFFEDRG